VRVIRTPSGTGAEVAGRLDRERNRGETIELASIAMQVQSGIRRVRRYHMFAPTYVVFHSRGMSLNL
jgi:hypothetical protein